jgi:hypothetical protein
MSPKELSVMKLKTTLKSTLLCGTLIASAGLLAGCSDHPNPFPGQDVTNVYRDFVPSSATKVAQGVGSVTYTSEGQGTAYIVDLTRLDQTTEKTAVPHVLTSQLLMKGQTILVDGTEQTVNVSGQVNVTALTYKITALKPDATYEIWFDKSKHTKF